MMYLSQLKYVFPSFLLPMTSCTKGSSWVAKLQALVPPSVSKPALLILFHTSLPDASQAGSIPSLLPA